MRDQVESLLREAVERVLRELGPEASSVPSDWAEKVGLTPTKTPEHGDFASNAALVLSKPLRAQPRELAARIVDALPVASDVVDRTEIAGPGFINVYLSRARWHDVVARILREGEAWGRSDGAQGATAQVEFVSANPTGPLTIGHGRNAVLGDAIARLLEAIGHKVTREYYFNDGGRQMRVLGESLRARYEQALGRDAELPEEGYQGEYLVEVARRLAEEQGEAWLGEDASRFLEHARDAMFESIEATLARLSIRFDTYFNERTVYENGSLEQALEDLRAKGVVYESEGAVWFRSTEQGLSRDRVLVRSSGEPTYLLPDIAYHRDKFRRGFARIVNIFGPDHIDQYPYLKAALDVLGHDTSGLELAMYQWVNLLRDGELVKMSTRKASFITIDEVLDDVGSDVFRFFMIERRADTHLDFDLDLARERSDRNPVYKIQYAHARLCSIERRAADAGVELGPPDGLPLARLESPEEIELAKRLGVFPDRIAHAAAEREPQEVARYLLDLASSFHTYVSDGQRHRVLSDDADLSLARLALVGAVRCTLANGLAILGISAPERM